jgi:hypothetical protein
LLPHPSHMLLVKHPLFRNLSFAPPRFEDGFFRRF